MPRKTRGHDRRPGPRPWRRGAGRRSRRTTRAGRSGRGKPSHRRKGRGSPSYARGPAPRSGRSSCGKRLLLLAFARDRRSTRGPPPAQALPACSVERALLARRRMQGSTMLSWEKIDAIPGWFMFQSYCVWRALLDQQARDHGRPVRDRRVARPLGVGARLLSQGRREALSVRPADSTRTAVHRAIRSVGVRARQHRAAVGTVGRSAGQARPAGHAPDGALVPYRRRAYRHRGLSRARVRQPHRQHRRHRGDRRLLLAALSGQHHRGDPLPREEPVPFPPARGRLQQGLSLPAREPAALHGLHGVRHEPRRSAAYGAKTTIFKTTGPWDTDAVGITDLSTTQARSPVPTTSRSAGT